MLGSLFRLAAWTYNIYVWVIVTTIEYKRNSSRLIHVVTCTGLLNFRQEVSRLFTIGHVAFWRADAIVVGGWSYLLRVHVYTWPRRVG